MKVIKKTVATIDEKECLQEAARILDTYCSQHSGCIDCYFRDACEESGGNLPEILKNFADEEVEVED